MSQRVINPELLLRSSDDRQPPPSRLPVTMKRPGTAMPAWFENRELAFLRNVRLLYQDYLDGSPLHRSDTKASVQLLGNLASQQPAGAATWGTCCEKGERSTGST